MRAPKPFTPDPTGRQKDGGVAGWISRELNQFLREIYVTLNRGLVFDKNFISFAIEETIAAGDTVEIVNKLDVIPNEWFTVDSTAGGPLIRGATAWTKNLLYIKNDGAADGTFKVRFFYTGRT